MRALAIILVTVALFGCDPMGPLPGGALAGEITTPPDDWTMMAKVETVQLETGPEDPYSVNLWIVSLGSRLYVAAGGGDTRWSRRISSNPKVRLRIDNNIFELHASSVDNDEELKGVRLAYIDKYPMNAESEEFNDSTVFRLDRPKSH